MRVERCRRFGRPTLRLSIKASFSPYPALYFPVKVAHPPLLSSPAQVQHNRRRTLIALPWIGVALRVRFEHDRSADGARLRGSEADRHAALSALRKEARRQVTCLGEVPTGRNAEDKAVFDVVAR